MFIGVISDIHDNLQNLDKALEIFQQHNLEVIVFCGDFCSPIPARILGQFNGKVHAVFGNGDGDRFLMLKSLQESKSSLILHGEYAELEYDGVIIAVTHYPFYAQALARTGDYQAVFSGHSHEPHQQRFGNCLWLNPGEIFGWKGAASCAIYDTTNNTAKFIAL